MGYDAGDLVADGGAGGVEEMDWLLGEGGG